MSASVKFYFLTLLVVLLFHHSLADDSSYSDSNSFNSGFFQAQQQLIFGQNAVQGFNTGFNNGFNTGFNNGATNGFNLGFSNGNVNGFNFGLNNFANQFTNNFNNLFTNNLITNLGTTFNNQFGRLNFNNGVAGGTPTNVNSATLNLNPATAAAAPASVTSDSSTTTSPNNSRKFSTGMLAGIIISGIIGGFLFGAAIVYGINFYLRQAATKQARASVSKTQNINNLKSTQQTQITPQPLATGNITVGELKV